MIYTDEEIAILREGGTRLARVLRMTAEKVTSGVTTGELNEYADVLIREAGDMPAFLHYQPEGAHRPYPASLCVSVNDEVVHGIPGDRVIKEGDIVSLDCGVTHRGLITDSAITVTVGSVDSAVQQLVDNTRIALAKGIEAARPGNCIGDIGAAIEDHGLKAGLSVVEELGGHGVGHVVHEEPVVPNFGQPGTGAPLEVGMVLALEPIFTLGSKNVDLLSDGYTFRTTDKKYAAHFEHTIVITEKGADILTKE